MAGASKETESQPCSSPRGASGLTLQERQLRTLVDCAPTALVTIDREGRILLVNADTEKLFGDPRDEPRAA